MSVSKTTGGYVLANGVDRATADAVFQLTLELAREQGTAFVLVTHDQALAERCDEVLRQ